MNKSEKGDVTFKQEMGLGWGQLIKNLVFGCLLKMTEFWKMEIESIPTKWNKCVKVRKYGTILGGKSKLVGLTEV